MKPIIFIELNEVPHVVLDEYARRSPFMARWLGESDRYTTVAADRVQLDPWIAWPSLHRGVNDETHGILHLGQSTEQADSYPPVWRMLQEAGVPVGVYGSLFSNSEPDLDPYAFFVPDVFSPHSRVNPQELHEFQDFNLAMTRASGRNADDKVSSGGSRSIAGLARNGYLRPSTTVRVARQLVDERIDRKRLSRRRNVQTELHADVFAKLIKTKRPQFATFYTNNVAAAMHRFWAASMPEGSIARDRLADSWTKAYDGEVHAALASVERLLRLLDSGRCGDVTVVVASAIGQEEIVAENHAQFVTVTNPEVFAEAVMGVSPDDYDTLPTMVPDFTFAFRSADLAAAAIDRLTVMTIDGGAPVETAERMHSKTLVDDGSRPSHIRHNYGEGDFKHSFTFCRSDDRTVHVSLQMDDYSGDAKAQLSDNRIYTFDEIGVGFVRHDEGVNCTAQHSPEGSLVVHGARGAAGAVNERPVSSLDVTPSLLEYFGVARPAWLQGDDTIKFR